MAKIAGRKNDGAWTRWNKWIVNQPAATLLRVGTLLEAMPEIGQLHTQILQYISDTGVSNTLFPSDVSTWADELSIGIPRQLWDGVTTYDEYSKVPDGQGGFVYQKDLQQSVFQTSIAIRAMTKKIRFATFEVTHLAGLTHPVPPSDVANTSTGDKKRSARERLVSYRASLTPDQLAAQKKILTRVADKSISPVLPGGTEQPKVRASKRRE